MDGIRSLQTAFRRRGHTLHAFIVFKRHAYGAAKGLEYRFCNVVRIVATQVVDVQGDVSMINEALKELCKQINIELADAGSRIVYMVLQTGPAREINDNP